MVKNNGLAAIAYIFGIIGGILVFLVAEKKDRLVRFHAAQSIFFNITVGIIAAILFALFAISFPYGIWIGQMSVIMLTVLSIFGVAVFVLWFFLVLKAYSGDKFKLPIIGNIAESLSG